MSATPSVPDGLSRRRVLTLFATAALGAALPAGLMGCTSQNESGDAAATFWKTIATAATRADPTLDVDSASAELERIVGPVDATEMATPNAAVLAKLAEQIAHDFTTGRTVVVTGWLLARTEVLLAVVAAGASS